MTTSLVPLPVNKSDWAYETGSSGGLGLGLFAGSGGSITLKNPKQELVRLRYGGLGVGASIGLRLPRVGKIELKIKGKGAGIGGSAEAFPSTGEVFVADDLVGRELTRDDFTGPCLYVEAGAGIAVGASSSAILFGLDPKLLAAAIVMGSTPAGALGSAFIQRQLLQSARGAIISIGVNVSAQVGAGAAAYIGGLF